MVAAVGSLDDTTVTVEGQVSYNWVEPVESIIVTRRRS